MTITQEMRDQRRIRAVIDELHLCGCGTDSAWDVVLAILERAETHDNTDAPTKSFFEPIALLADGSDQAPRMWVEFAAKVLDGQGLLEHGCSIGWAWLTDLGREVLAFLRQYSTDKDCWPDWATSVDMETIAAFEAIGEDAWREGKA